MDEPADDALADLLEAVGRTLPGYVIRTVVPLGSGLDNTSVAINDELVVRRADDPDPVRRSAAVTAQARLLSVLPTISPLPVPTMRFTVADAGILAYDLIPGRPLLSVPRPQWNDRAIPIATELGRFLKALHGAPVERMAGLVDTVLTPLADWRDDADRDLDHLPTAYLSVVKSFVETPPPDHDLVPVFTHNDLGIEHVLVASPEWTVTGIIDWSDAAIADSAYDFGLILRDFGPDGFDAALGGYPADAGLRDRAWFYARCKLIEDLAYGLDTGQQSYVDKSVAGMRWLFPV